jgi:DNA mismatch endonuclease, patch repair protein
LWYGRVSEYTPAAIGWAAIISLASRYTILPGRTRSQVSEVMKRVRSENTAPELLLRRAIWKLGLRYRTQDRSLPGKPDIVFSGPKIAVFVDGDFWHGDQWRLRGFSSSESQLKRVANASYWSEKIQRNVARDLEINRLLTEMGWRVIRLWESDILRDPIACATQVASEVKAARETNVR